jgi:DNA-binding transcriptional ArsR family regulator
MPSAKNTSRSTRPSTFREPAALRWLSSSLDAAEQALAALREDAGRDVSQGARDLHKDLRAFISNARRDTGKLAKALARDFEHAQKQLTEGTGTAASPERARRRARSDRAAASRTSTPKPARSRAVTSTAAPTSSAEPAEMPASVDARRPRAAARTAQGETKTVVLEALASGEAMTAGEVASATGLGRGTVSTTLSKLAKSGEVTKAARGYQLPG